MRASISGVLLLLVLISSCVGTLAVVLTTAEATAFPIVAQQDSRGTISSSGIDPWGKYVAFVIDYNTSCSFRYASIDDQFGSIKVIIERPKTAQYCTINSLTFRQDPSGVTWLFWQDFSDFFYYSSCNLEQNKVYSLRPVPVAGAKSISAVFDSANGRVVFTTNTQTQAFLMSMNWDTSGAYQLLALNGPLPIPSVFVLQNAPNPYNLLVQPGDQGTYWLTSTLNGAPIVELSVPGRSLSFITTLAINGTWMAFFQASAPKSGSSVVAWSLETATPYIQDVCDIAMPYVGAWFVVDGRWAVATMQNRTGNDDWSWAMISCDLLSNSWPSPAAIVAQAPGYSYIITLPPFIQRLSDSTKFLITRTDGGNYDPPTTAFLWMVDVAAPDSSSAIVVAKHPVPTSTTFGNRYVGNSTLLTGSTYLWTVQGGGLGYFMMTIDLSGGGTRLIAQSTNQYGRPSLVLRPNRLIWGEYMSNNQNTLILYDTLLQESSITSQTVLNITGYTFWANYADGYQMGYSSTFSPTTSTILALNTTAQPAQSIVIQQLDNFLNTYVWPAGGNTNYSWVVSQSGNTWAQPSYIYSTNVSSTAAPVLRAKAASFNNWNATFIPGCLIYFANNNAVRPNSDGWSFGVYGPAMDTTCEVPSAKKKM